MSEEIVNLNGVSKYYKIYQSKADRLWEALLPLKRKYHSEFYALKNINLSVKKGEIVGILGKNGSGKSTLLKLISGIISENSGSKIVKGDVAPLLELGAGFNLELNGYENVEFYCSTRGVSKSRMPDIFKYVEEFTELGDFLKRPIKTYSSGMKSRLAFAAAVCIKPDILILDEVLSVGDATFRKKSFHKIQSLMKGGATVFFVSHSAEQILKICSRAIMLDCGEIICQGGALEVTEAYRSYSNAPPEIANEILESIRLKKFDPIRSSKAVSKRENYFDEISSKYIKLVDVKLINKKNENSDSFEVSEEAIIEAKFEVLKEMNNFFFDFSICNKEAFLLGSFSYPGRPNKLNHQAVTNALPGEIIDLSVNFKCFFIPNIYFITLNVISIINDSDHLVLRVPDVKKIKIVDSSKRLENHYGHIFFDFKGSMSVNGLAE